jgi:hypothetical protein
MECYLLPKAGWRVNVMGGRRKEEEEDCPMEGRGKRGGG